MSGRPVLDVVDEVENDEWRCELAGGGEDGDDQQHAELLAKNAKNGSSQRVVARATGQVVLPVGFEAEQIQLNVILLLVRAELFREEHPFARGLEERVSRKFTSVRLHR